MAEQVNIDILIQTAASAKNVGELKDSLIKLKEAQEKVGKGTDDFKKLDDSIKLTTKSMLDSALQAAQNATNMRQLGAAMKELKSLQEQVDSSSPDFDRLADGINETEGRIGDLNDQFNTLTGSGMERTTKATGLLKEGFNSLDFGKIGIATNALSKQMGGLQASIAKTNPITQGFKGALGGLSEGMKGLGQTGVGTLIKSFAQLTLTMLANPIFLIGAIIVGVIAAFVALKDKIKFINDIFEGMTAIVQKVIDTFKWLSDTFLGTTFQAQDAAKKQEAALAKTAEAVEDRYNREIKFAQAAGKDTTQLEKMKAYAQKATADSQIKNLESQIAMTGKATEKQLEDLEKLKKARQGFADEAQALTIKQITDANNKKAEDDAKAEEERKKKAEEARKKREEEDRQRLADNAKLLADVKKQNEEAYLNSIVDEEQRAIEKARIESENRVKANEATKADKKVKAEAQIAEETRLENEITKIKDDFSKKRQEKEKADREKAAQESKDRAVALLEEMAEIDKNDFDRQIKELEGNERAIAKIKYEALLSDKAAKLAIARETITDATKLREEEAKINRDFDQKEIDALQAIEDAKKNHIQKMIKFASDQAMSGLATLQSFAQMAQQNAEKANSEILSNDDKQRQQIEKNNTLTEEQKKEQIAKLNAITQKQLDENNKKAKRAFDINKAAAIATAVIQTYLAAQSAFASQVIPGDPSSVVRGAIAAALAVAGGIANIAKIKASKFEGAQMPSGGDSSGVGSLPEGGPKPKTETAANFNAGSFYGLGQGPGASQKPMVQKVVVVETDITKTQKDVQKIETRATQTL